MKASSRSLVSTNRVGLKRVNPDQDNVIAADVTDSEVATRQSPFRTPPSLSYCHDKVTMCSIVWLLMLPVKAIVALLDLKEKDFVYG